LLLLALLTLLLLLLALLLLLLALFLALFLALLPEPLLLRHTGDTAVTSPPAPTTTPTATLLSAESPWH